MEMVLRRCILVSVWVTSLLGSLSFFPLISFAESLTLVLDWLPNPDHAPLLVAQYGHFFKQQGLSVQIKTPSSPDEGPKLVAAGTVDLAITSQPRLIQQVDQGWDLVRIATLIDKPLACLLVKESGPIKQLSDLKGKRIGRSTHATSLLLTSLLRKAQLSLSDVQWVYVKYNLVPSLVMDHLDAISGAMRNVTPIELEALGQSTRYFSSEDGGIPSYEELVLVAKRDCLKDPRFGRFVAALQESTCYLLQHPQESWDLCIKSCPGLDGTVNWRIWFSTLSYFANNPIRFNKKGYQEFASFLKTQGMITHDLKGAQLGIEILPICLPETESSKSKKIS